MNIKALLACLGLFFFVQIVTWFQLNGQFFSNWFRNNTFILCLLGIPISYLYIEATKFGYIAFEGTIWPGKLLGFAMGIVTFALCANLFMNEGITTKTAISILLALVLVCIQVFWK